MQYATSVFYLVCWILAGSLATAAQPGLRWQGEVDGTVVLHLRGKHLKVEVRNGAPVLGQSFKLRSALPESRVPVGLKVIEGRGRVAIVQQPAADNDYELQVMIEDLQDGAYRYVLEIDWDDRGRG